MLFELLMILAVVFHGVFFASQSFHLHTIWQHLRPYPPLAGVSGSCLTGVAGCRTKYQ